MRSPRATLWMLLALAGAAAARAEIVVLVTGDFLKCESHQVVDGGLRLELPFGGTMTLPLSTVERVLEDEVMVPPGEQIVSLPGVEVDFVPGQPVPETPFGETIHSLGRRHGINPRLIAAVVAAESAFNADALSSQGAQGLMQIMPATARRFGVPASMIFDPRINLEIGVRYLAQLRQRYAGDLVLMLAAYNAGESTVERFGGVPPFRETQNYIRRIERFYLEGSR